MSLLLLFLPMTSIQPAEKPPSDRPDPAPPPGEAEIRQRLLKVLGGEDDPQDTLAVLVDDLIERLGQRERELQEIRAMLQRECGITAFPGGAVLPLVAKLVLREQQKLASADATIQRFKSVLALLGFDPAVQPDASIAWATTALDLIRRAVGQVAGEVDVAVDYRRERVLDRLRATLKPGLPEGMLFRPPQAGGPVYLSALLTQLLAAKITLLRGTLSPEHQEARIAQELGALLPGESLIQALDRMRAGPDLTASCRA